MPVARLADAREESRLHTPDCGIDAFPGLHRFYPRAEAYRWRDLVGNGVLRRALGTRAGLIACDHADARVQRGLFRGVLVQSCGKRYLRRKPLEELSAASAGAS